MTYTIGWSDGEAEVDTPAETERVLDQIAVSGDGPYLVHVAPRVGPGALIELVWGDSERAMLSYADDDWDGQAFEPGLAPLTRDIGYDYGSVEPDRTRLSTKLARDAVAEFVATGQRPTCVSWEQ